MAVVHLGNNKWEGNFNDVKPLGVPVGAEFREIETDCRFSWNGSRWVPTQQMGRKTGRWSNGVSEGILSANTATVGAAVTIDTDGYYSRFTTGTSGDTGLNNSTQRFTRADLSPHYRIYFRPRDHSGSRYYFGYSSHVQGVHLFSGASVALSGRESFLIGFDANSGANFAVYSSSGGAGTTAIQVTDTGVPMASGAKFVFDIFCNISGAQNTQWAYQINFSGYTFVSGNYPLSGVNLCFQNSLETGDASAKTFDIFKVEVDQYDKLT